VLSLLLLCFAMKGRVNKQRSSEQVLGLERTGTAKKREKLRTFLHNERGLKERV